MCTRFVYNGNDTIIGFNFDIDISEYEHKVLLEKARRFLCGMWLLWSASYD